MKLIDRLLSPVAPALCLACGGEGDVVCDWCFPDLLHSEAERCIACNKLSDNAKTCRSCQNRLRLPKYVWVRTSYDSYGKELLAKLKFSRMYSAHERIAAYMSETLPFLANDTLVMHVPTSSNRARTRGYDQSQLLAKALAKQRSLRYEGLLTRLTTTRQVGATRLERQKQLIGAYHVQKSGIDNKTPILLVDDIYTTGGTLSAATVALKEAGYKNISAVVFAKAL